MKLTYDISQFGKWLISRQTADFIFEAMTKNDFAKMELLEIDFSKVIFVSRSFADQLVKLISKSEIEIKVLNPSSKIEKLLRTVKNNSTRRRTPLNVYYPHYVASSTKDYFNRLEI